MNRGQTTCRRGFTLLELLCAIGLLTVLAVAGSDWLRLGRTRISEAVRVCERQQCEHLLVSGLRRDLLAGPGRARIQAQGVEGPTGIVWRSCDGCLLRRDGQQAERLALTGLDQAVFRQDQQGRLWLDLTRTDQTTSHLIWTRP